MSGEEEGISNQPGKTRLADVGEDRLIERLREVARSADPAIIKSIGDDAAVISPSDRVAITTDLLIEDVHFILDRHPPRLLGRKAMAANLSDLAAMAAKPRFALLSLAAPPRLLLDDFDRFVNGFIEMAAAHGVSLIGGDLTRADRMSISVTLIGDAPPPAPAYRSGAREGDLLWVSGELGDAALGLMRLLELPLPVGEKEVAEDQLSEALLRFLDPTPRVGLGGSIAPMVSAMMDLSDGMATDLPRLLAESGGLGAEIDLTSLPLSGPFRERFEVCKTAEKMALRAALAGGEDYELMFTSSPLNRDRVLAAAGDIRVTPIGRITASSGIRLVSPHGVVAMPAPLFSHFGEGGRE